MERVCEFLKKSGPIHLLVLALLLSGCGLVIRSSTLSNTIIPSIYYPNILQAGSSTVCSLRRNSTIYCWGANGSGQTGTGVTGGQNNSPVQVIGPGGTGFMTNAVAVAVYTTSCAMLSNGSDYCWGSNSNGQFANGTSGGNIATPTEIPGVGGVGFLSNIIGGSETISAVVLNSSGQVFAWGNNSNGQAGINVDGGNQLTATQVLGPGGTGFLSNITQVTSGNNFNCAVSAQGYVYCWGFNATGEIGNGTSGADVTVPTQVVGPSGVGALSNIISVYARGPTACALNSSGNLYCWGGNANGLLAQGTVGGSSNIPVLVPLSNVINMGGSSANICAVTSSGNVYCWGDNTHGSLGNGNTGAATGNLSLVTGVGGTGVLSNIVGITGGNGTLPYMCAVDTNNNVYCWGGNDKGQIGNGTSGTDQLTPEQVTGLP